MNLRRIQEQLDAAWDAIQNVGTGPEAISLERLHIAVHMMLTELAKLDPERSTDTQITTGGLVKPTPPRV